MALSNYNKFQALLWKNCIIVWSDIKSLVEINIIPFILSLALIPLRIILPVVSTNEKIFNETVAIDNLDLFMKTPYAPNATNTVELHLAYSPSTSPVFEEIVKAAATSLNLEYSGYTDAMALASALKERNYLAGVEFDNSLAYITKYPEHLSFKLRFPDKLRKYDSNWYTDQHFLFPFEPTDRNDIDGGSPVGYLREGFLPIQNAISTAFITQAAKWKDPLPKIVMQRYPMTATATATSLLMTYFHSFIGILFVLAYDSMSLYIVKCIMEEKEKQLTEVMKIFGLQSWIQWSAWFVSSCTMMSICTIYLTTILLVEWKADIVYITYASSSLIVFFFMAYSMSYVTMQFLGITFFSKAATAAFVMELLCYITLTPYFLLYLKYNQISLGLKLILCLLPNVAMCTGVRTIFIKERSGEGWHWSNMFIQASADDSLSLGLIIVMMLISCVLYMVLCMYFERILPSAYGVPQKWNYPFKKSYWKSEHELAEVNPIIIRENPEGFEAEPLRPKVGLQIINLCKQFGNHLAVNHVSLNLYRNEVTVLLGHNGAGKTTLISMLTGMIPTTSGTAIINGYDIRTDLEAARLSLSICPQHNILFDELTVKQHLVFYGRLKGLQGNALKAEVESYMKKTDLEKKANVESAKLSGGMKRKLSVCAALCGGTKVVLLDEPSSGLDPVARRHLWDLIISEKHGRTILLTTHFMDEAEALADRIAILSAGQLQCHGTPFFLKKKFGCGYILICVKKTNCDSSEVTKLLEKYIPDIQPTTDIGSELSYRLLDSYTPQFRMMLQDLESHSDELKLDGYGISITSLEDVFMKVGAATQENDDVISFQAVIIRNDHRAKGRALILSQWQAMILKKFTFRIRHMVLFAAQIGLPIAFGILLWILLKTNAIASGSSLAPLALDLFEFPETATVLETTPNVKPGSLEASISKNYKKFVESHGSDHVLETTGGRSFIDYILELARTNQNLINNKYIAAATVDKGQITAWLNNEPLHTAPITLNLIHNAMARSIIGHSAGLNVINYPLLPSLSESVARQDFRSFNLHYVASSLILLCLCFISPFYVLFLVKERQSRAKLLEFVGGVRATTFWMSHFLIDMFTLTITMAILLIAISFSDIDGFTTFGELSRMGVILIFANSAILPLMYICADSSSTPAAGYSFTLGILMYSVYVCYIVHELSMLGNINADWLLLVPSHCLQRTMVELKLNYDIRNICQTSKKEIGPSFKCDITPFFAWKKPGIFRHLLCFVITSSFFFSILFIKESHFMSVVWDWTSQREAPVPAPDAYLDKDVEHEKAVVDSLLPSDIANEHLVLDRLTKYYKKFLAVNEISLIVREAECFGLLGMNGAGKTSTFKMLIGDEKISSGQAYVKGISLRRNMHEVYEEIGYCPQFDALLDDMTGREMLKMFCLIHGIPEDDISDISRELAVGFGFAKYYNRPVHSYSGGNKRKLSVAIAVLGNPSIIYLDEPTNGMDPGARRQLWNILCKFRDSGKSMVLTSHSLDECEALCTRLAIMVNGEFKCLGSIQHLKNRFTKGLTLKIKVGQDPEQRRESTISNQSGSLGIENLKENVQRVMQFVKNEFPHSQLKHEIEGLLSFNIPLKKITWSEIFGIMEDNKEALFIEDYSITQTSLEEIFLYFAEKQLEDSRV